MTGKRKGGLLIAFLIVMSGFQLALTVLPGTVKATTLYVGGGGPGNYTTIQSAIDNATPGNTVYVYNGTYNESVIVNKTLNLTGERRDTTIIDGGTTGDVVNVTADWVNMTGFNITNSGLIFGDAGIELYGSQNCSITNNTIVANGAGISLVHSHNNSISYNMALDNWAGVFLQYSENNTISNNTTDNVYGILLISSSNNNIISGNTVSNNLEGIVLDTSNDVTVIDNVLSRSGISLGGSENCNVTNNTVSRTSYAIRLWDSDNTTIAHNTISETDGAIWVEISDFSRIIDNNMSSGYSFGINLCVSNNNTIERNHISSSFLDGILLDDSINALIFNNTMTGNGIYIEGDSIEYWSYHIIDPLNTVNGRPVEFLKNATGGSVPQNASQVILANCTDILVEQQNLADVVAAVQIGFSSGSEVVNNTVSNSKRKGIRLVGSADSYVANNVLSSNNSSIQLRGSSSNRIVHNNVSGSFTGIEMLSSHYNKIVWNDISLTGYTGIFLRSSANNTISNNTVSLSSIYGYWLESSDNNSIYHNSNLDNVNQAFDFDNTNRWDNGYPSGGNYWSDYSGADMYRGPNQDQPGSDSIGDVPYSIGPVGAREDSYPLVFPVGTLGPPVDVMANLDGPSFADILLEWNLSRNDGSATNFVTHYEVLRGADSFSQNASGYQLIATLGNSSSSFIDPGRGEGDQRNYFYVVCAVDVWNKTACSLNQAGKFTRSLSIGPNLLSVPLLQSNESLEVVLQTVSFDSAWFYDAMNQGWKSYASQKPYPMTLMGTNHTMGIWVDVTSSSNFTVAGAVPSRTSIRLQPGWNLIGFPSFKENYTVGFLKSETNSTFVEGMSLVSEPYRLRRLADAEVVKIGFGYWIWTYNAWDWIVEGS